MNFGVSWWLLLLASSSGAEKWSWPEGAAASVRIDTKVRFVDGEDGAGGRRMDNDKETRNVMSDELPFRQPVETEGFYNRPPGAGRYPVHVEAHRAPYRVDGQAIYPVHNEHNQQNKVHSDGTLDSLQYCKCVDNPDCNPRPDSLGTCGVDKYLCCYRRPNKVAHKNSEFFNEVEDERPMLLPGQQNLARPFPPPPSSSFSDLFGPGQGHDNVLIGVGVFDKPQGELIRPDGPTGAVGPQHGTNGPHVLVGPEGPTGIIGPANNNNDERRSESAQRGVLVGPVGPTGNVGYGRRTVLVGPGGPTGMIGPGRGGRGPGLLVGPGGPTGIIGPGYGRQPGPGLLTGPGGPTGMIGPGRPILVGPGGPTGKIGPQGYFGK